MYNFIIPGLLLHIKVPKYCYVGASLSKSPDNRIVRLFLSCSSDVLLELGRSFCRSFYCSHLWTCYKKSSFSKICVTYNNFYRKIVHVSGHSSASAMFVENNIPNFECLILRDIYTFIKNI